MTLRLTSPFIFQIHWPVASQRKTECILSGKDTNVSKSLVVALGITKHKSQIFDLRMFYREKSDV